MWKGVYDPTDVRNQSNSKYTLLNLLIRTKKNWNISIPEWRNNSRILSKNCNNLLTRGKITKINKVITFAKKYNIVFLWISHVINTFRTRRRFHLPSKFICHQNNLRLKFELELILVNTEFKVPKMFIAITITLSNKALPLL